MLFEAQERLDRVETHYRNNFPNISCTRNSTSIVVSFWNEHTAKMFVSQIKRFLRNKLRNTNPVWIGAPCHYFEIEVKIKDVST